MNKALYQDKTSFAFWWILRLILIGDVVNQLIAIF